MDIRGGVGRIGAIALLCATLTACAPTYRNHGYTPDDDALALVEVGRSSMQDVADAVGRPSAQGVLEAGGWFYVQSRFKHFTFNEPEEVDRQVVAVSFDAKGIVSNVERFGLEQGQPVVLSRRVTQSGVKDVSFIKQLLGTIGRVNASDVFDNGPF